MQNDQNDKSAVDSLLSNVIAPRLLEIRNKAEEIVGGHKLAMRAENMRRPEYKDHAALTPYMTRNNNGYIYMYWGTHGGWRTVGGRRVKNTKHLKTKKGGDYSVEALTKHAQDWELARVLETEELFKALRRKQTALGEARLALANLTTVL